MIRDLGVPEQAARVMERKRMTTKAERPLLSPRRLAPLLVVAMAAALCLAFGVQDYFSLDALRDNRQWLAEEVAAHRVLAVAVFALVYVGVVALSIPGASILTIAGGLVLGQILATAVVVVAATLGATLLFLVAKTSLGDALKARAAPWLQRMADGFAANALSYLLVLRLIPLFPFFVVNLVPAFLGVKLRTYVLATFLGIIPGTFVYASFGAGLGRLLDAGREVSLDSVLTPQIATALVGLAVLALLPVGYKKLQAARRAKHRP